MSNFELNKTTGQFRPKPAPDPEYLQHYSEEALETMGEEAAEELLPHLEAMAPDVKVKLDDPVTHENNLEYGLADRHYEQFAHIESWDDVISFAADLRVNIDRHKFELGALVNFSCPKKTGRPKADDEKWNVSSLAGSIGEDRSTLSQLANNEEFWHPGIREELPPQVSWRQLARARVDSGWRPGKVVTQEHLTTALGIVLKIADGIYEKKKNAVVVTPLQYAKRIYQAASKALVCAKGQDVIALFLTIAESADEIVEVLEDGEDQSEIVQPEPRGPLSGSAKTQEAQREGVETPAGTQGSL